MKRIRTIEFISGLFIVLFLYTATSKILGFSQFKIDINTQPFPNWLTPLITWTLPAVEILIAFSLLFEVTRLIGLWASFFLMLLFTAYTALILFHFFSKVPCSCGGVISNLTWQQHLIFNSCFLVLAILAIILFNKRSLLNPNYNQTVKNILLAQEEQVFAENLNHKK